MGLIPFLSPISIVYRFGYKKNKMQNDKGEIVDLYIPRKCSASNRLIGAKDESSIQINFCDVDPQTGRMLSTNQTFAICGAIRRMGQSDDSIYRLARESGLAK